MKNIFLLIVFSLLILTAKTQYVTQSAEGKSSVLLPLNGASAGFDIGKSEISFGANNYSKALDRNNKKIFRNGFIGTNLSVKNSTGIGQLFKSGDIVGEGNFLGFLGFNLNNNQSILDEWNSSYVSLQIKLEQLKRKQLIEQYKVDIVGFIDIGKDEIDIDDQTVRDNIVNQFKYSINNATDGVALSKAIRAIIGNNDNRLKDFISNFRTLVDERHKIYFESLAKFDLTKSIDAAFSDFTKKHTIKRLTPFIFGGIEARNFSLYTGLDRTALSKSFIDTLYRGGLFGIGINGQIGNLWVGITYAYIDGDNFSNLDSKEYTLKTTDSSGNQTLISEKKITGFSGNYSKVESNHLNIDLIREFKLGDTSRLLATLYYRGILSSRNTDYLKNISNFGIGTYFIGNKGKFLGGLYVELPDIDNNIEKGKPITERSIRPPFKKLTFGVVTKFALNSILGFSNRPRRPE